MAEEAASTRAEADRLALLSDVLRSFADATTDYPRLLETIAARTAAFLGHFCSIRLLSEDGLRLETVAMSDPLEAERSPVRELASRPIVLASSAALRGALASGESLLLAETRIDERAVELEEPLRSAARALAIKSVIVAPLVARKETYGVLFIVSRGEDAALHHVDRELAEGLARHAALAISNARTLQRLTLEIEARERVQSSLESAELARQYEKSIVDTVYHPLVVLDAGARVRSVNRAFCELFRTTEGEAAGRPLVEVADGALDTPQTHALLAEILPVRGGALVPDVAVVVDTPRLGRRTMRVNARKMYRPGNGADTLLLALEDVSERIDAAEKLARRALLLESMGEAVIGGDLEFRIEDWNPAAERLFGWSADEVRGLPIEQVLAVRGLDPMTAVDGVRSGRPTHSTVRIQRRNGDWLDIETSSLPVKSGGVTTGFVFVVKDVSDRQRLEREARRQVADLELANRELESFSYSVSHDLRAPVRAIAGFALLLEEDHAGELGEEGRRLLGVVRKNAQRMGLLIDDLLAFSRTGRQALAIEEVDMEALAREALEDARRAEGEREYEVRIAPLPKASADRSLIDQVWRNLLANAVKYSRGRSPAVIEVDGETTGDEVVYRVRDNGIGFDMRYSEKLFKVFERLHAEPRFEGTGVGLALVDRIVRRHGGRVWAEGSPGAGATFHFALPRERQA
ncbi:MAG: PAS domain S-box protein [Labilithrix sp.]|nr:PAS domain S-box protein [Labilithrix sp.]MCW5834759.1 PAS domain S-box protein [Labilithrix sp.]